MGIKTDQATHKERLDINSLNDTGVTNLIGGIVNQAVNDRLQAPECSVTRREVEKFFRSHYFQRLTNLDGKTILRKCQQMEAEKRRKTKRRFVKQTN